MIEGVYNGKPGKGQSFDLFTIIYHTAPYLFCLLFCITIARPMLMGPTEIAEFYGSHVTKNALSNHFTRDITPNVKLLSEAYQRQEDPKDVILVEGVRSGNGGKGQNFIAHSAHYTFSLCWRPF